MITTFKVRKAATSPWIRREERDWVRTSRQKNVENQIGPPSSLRTSFGPVRELLTCDKGSLPEAGREVARWLDEQKNIHASILDWLSHRAISGQVAGQPIGDFNRIAAIEILARYSHRSAPWLIEQYLAEPVRENHLYAIPLARLPQVLKSQESQSIARSIVSRYRESRELQAAGRWRERFAVEVFRTLAELSPTDVVNALAVDLPSIADFELTPILESISVAARRLDRSVLSRSSLGDSVRLVWGRYLEDGSVDDLGNRPGIMGRLLELAGRVGESLGTLIGSLEGHPLKMQVLYQFVRRPLDFAPVKDRLRWYANVSKLMVEAKQSFALKRFLTEVVIPDMPPEWQGKIIGKLTENQADRAVTP